MNEPLSIDPSKIESAVLRRLIDEVKYEQATGNVNAYNRIHNRHNRSSPIMPRPAVDEVRKAR